MCVCFLCDVWPVQGMSVVRLNLAIYKLEVPAHDRKVSK